MGQISLKAAVSLGYQRFTGLNRLTLLKDRIANALPRSPIACKSGLMDTQATEPRPITRGRRLHLQALRRSLVPKSAVLERTSLAGRVVAACFPWSVDDYPGRHRGFRAVLGDRVTWAYVRHWMAGRRPIPPWARAVLADYLRSRARVALELAAELDALPVRPDKRRVGNRTSDNEGQGDGR